MNSFGQNLRLSIWGESHGKSVGVCLDGVPVGIALCEDDFMADLNRRRSGALGTTPRSEQDTPQIISGVFNGHTTGAPLSILFQNKDRDSNAYNNLTHHFRPSHADMVANDKYKGYNDPRGGGHFSGRITVALVAAGVVAKRIVSNTSINGRIIEIGGCNDASRFDEIILDAMADNDSVGGVIECRATGVERGIGEPFFNSVESVISHLLFSIPAVKGVEFGSGFEVARSRGSVNNDPIVDGEGKTASNNAGGIDGGICSGNELVVRVAMKPTPSISQIQQSYDATSDSIQPLVIEGRHDACIVQRAAVVVEAAVAIAIADLSLTRR